MKEEFLDNFKEAIEAEDREIHMEDNFREYEEWDSLANLSLVAMLDDEYEVIIEPDDFKKIDTVGQLWEEVKQRSSKVEA